MKDLPLIYYSDSAFVRSSPFGVTIDFMQPDNVGKDIPVQSIGMSLAHAKEFIKVLEKRIIETERLKKL